MDRCISCVHGWLGGAVGRRRALGWSVSAADAVVRDSERRLQCEWLLLLGSARCFQTGRMCQHHATHAPVDLHPSLRCFVCSRPRDSQRCRLSGARQWQYNALWFRSDLSRLCGVFHIVGIRVVNIDYRYRYRRYFRVKVSIAVSTILFRPFLSILWHRYFSTDVPTAQQQTAWR